MIRESNSNLNQEIKQMKKVIAMKDVLILTTDLTINYQQNKDELYNYPFQGVSSSPSALIFGTRHGLSVF